MFTTGLYYVWYVELSTALGSNGELKAFFFLQLLENKFKQEAKGFSLHLHALVTLLSK